MNEAVEDAENLVVQKEKSLKVTFYVSFGIACNFYFCLGGKSPRKIPVGRNIAHQNKATNWAKGTVIL